MSVEKNRFGRDFLAKRTYLRLLAAVVLTICIAVFVGIALFITQRLHHSDFPSAVNGSLDLSSANLARSPAYLNGAWELLSPDGSTRQVSFPIVSIGQATQDATYRLRFRLPEGESAPLYLCIPTYEGSLRVFLNGTELFTTANSEQWVAYQAMGSLFPLTSLTSGFAWQELVLQGNFSQESMTLYKRPVVLGNIENITTLVFFDGTNEMFLIGILILVLINGFVFMLLRPTHNIISMMTLFDTAIMLRVVFSMGYMHSFAKSLIPGLELSDTFANSAKLFILMLGGLLGCLLSGALYDPGKRAPRWLTLPPILLYIFFAILFPLNVSFFEQYGRFFLYSTYVYTFLGVGWQFWLCMRSPPTGNTHTYYILQFTKTLYIGGLVFIDIFLWTEYFDFMVLFYLYGIFFIMHVLVRLYDNNQSYRNVEVLNQTLESTVAERTLELSQANQILSELSIRDPLTKCFNRLYFEGAAELACAQHEADGTPVHLCMLDLDFFKSVNDTYGHDAGDEQLQHLVRLVEGCVGKDAVFSRIGGEEFTLLFTGKTDEQVQAYVERVHTTIAADARSNPRHTTASLGVARLEEGQTQKNMLKNADLALYEAKSAGRNQVVWFEGKTASPST